jgi:hypothetical protein
MKIGNSFGAVYFAVFAVVVIGSWLFMRSLEPKQKKKWYPRISLLSIAIIGPFLLLPSIVWGQWLFALIGFVFICFVGYSSVKLIRVCESCGFMAQPQGLVIAAKFCPKCGATMTPSTLFGSDRV